MNLVIY